jgi:hypothetical protein
MAFEVAGGQRPGPENGYLVLVLQMGYYVVRPFVFRIEQVEYLGPVGERFARHLYHLFIADIPMV